MDPIIFRAFLKQEQLEKSELLASKLTKKGKKIPSKLKNEDY